MSQREDGERRSDRLRKSSQAISRDEEDSPDPQQLAGRRSYLAELQQQLTELQAQHTARKDRSEVRRTLQATKNFGRLAQSFSVAYRDEQFAAQVRPLLEEERRRVAAVMELDGRLKEARLRQRSLRQTLDQARSQLPKPGHADRHLLQLQQNAELLKEYNLLLAEHTSLMRQYQMTSQLLCTADVHWLGLREWMQVVRPRYHALRPPHHVFRAAAAAADSSMEVTDTSPVASQ